MTTDPERIEAEIQQWSDNNPFLKLLPAEICSLANHLAYSPTPARDTRHERLVAVARKTLEALYSAQGQWANVLIPYAPEWTVWMKDAAEELEAALKPEPKEEA